MRGKEERETMGKGGKSRASSKERTEYFHHLDKVTTSFFFTNIPDEATTEDLWKLFLKFGRVWEIYMPKKLDKRGRRFGFVKFKVVSEVELLNDKLQDVWMGTFKLLVNISRFARSDNKTDSSQSNHGTRSALQLKEVGSGSSFRTALMGGASASKAVVMKVLVNEELCKELQGSVVGTLAREKDVRRIQTTLYMEGFRSISVTHMGGNMVLLRSPVEGDVERLLKSRMIVSNTIFRS
jgi:RNA recognition motif-containing protein